MISLGNLGFEPRPVSEDVVRRAHEDRIVLVEQLTDRFEQLKGKLPAELVADIIFEICEWFIARRELTPNQPAFCDFSSRTIFLSASMRQLAKARKSAPQALQRTTLGHELAHIRLHSDEMEAGEFRSYLGPGCGVHDSRTVQREHEANCYAAVFLVPYELLKDTEQARYLQQAYEAQGESGKPCTLTSREIWSQVTPLAEKFGITRSMMSASLEEYRYIDRVPNRGRSGYHNLRIRQTQKDGDWDEN